MAEKKASKKTSSKKVQFHMYGSIVFGVGLAIAIIAGLINFESSMIKQIIGATLVILGLAVGVLNITKEESVGFMVAGIVIATLIPSLAQTIFQLFSVQSNTLVQIVSTMLVNIIIFIVPATVVVALKSAFSYAKDE